MYSLKMSNCSHIYYFNIFCEKVLAIYVPSLIYLSHNLSIVYKRKGDRLLGRCAVASIWSEFTGFRINVTATFPRP
jgi:hypothetical protein